MRRRLALLALAVAAAGCGGPAPDGPNVLLITVDTLRADRLGCYGYERDTSPRLDAFAQESVLFENAYSHAPFTAPSHASLFTSLHTEEHGVLSWGMKLAPGARTMAERFGDAGWRTGAFYNHPSLELNDLERGFDEVGKRYFEPADDTVADFLAWVDAGGAPFAAWVHLWDVHRPYGYRDWTLAAKYVQRAPLAFEETRFGAHDDVSIGREEKHYNVNPERRAELGELDGDDWTFVANRYDGGVWYADRALGELFDALAERGVLDDTVVVVTSDHGESLTERDACWFTHDPFLYEETLRVPLFIRFPGGEHGGRRVERLARGIDVLPTLLHAADLPVSGARGRSLVDAIEGSEEGEVYLFAQTQAKAPKEIGGEAKASPDGWVEHRQAVSDGRRKLVVDLATGRTSLYDLERDPGEERDVARDPAYADDRRRLTERFQAFRALPKAGQNLDELTPEERKLLEDLGYL